MKMKANDSASHKGRTTNIEGATYPSGAECLGVHTALALIRPVRVFATVVAELYWVRGGLRSELRPLHPVECWFIEHAEVPLLDSMSAGPEGAEIGNQRAIFAPWFW